MKRGVIKMAGNEHPEKMSDAEISGVLQSLAFVIRELDLPYVDEDDADVLEDAANRLFKYYLKEQISRTVVL